MTAARVGASIVEIPLTALFARRPAVNRWGLARWDLAALAESDGGDAAVAAATEADDSRRFALVLRLFSDQCESYWANLDGGVPALFVVCEAGQTPPIPIVVTASGDEAAGLADAEGEVFRAPMPPAVAAVAARFVDANYRPQIKKKRRRE